MVPPVPEKELKNLRLSVLTLREMDQNVYFNKKLLNYE